MIQLLFQWRRFKQTIEHKVILRVLGMKTLIHRLDELQVRKSKAIEMIRRPAQIESHDQRSIESVLAIEFELSSSVITRERLGIAFHVQNV